MDDRLSNVQMLAAAINDDSRYHKEYFYTAGYDSPYKWWDRHNEVWLVAKN